MLIIATYGYEKLLNVSLGLKERTQVNVLSLQVFMSLIILSV